MKLNTSNLFILIWVIHLFVFYTTYLSVIAISKNNYSELYNALFGFVIGLYGGLEQFPLFFLIPLSLMFILIKTKLKERWFVSYVIAVCLSYLINYLWMFSNNKHNIIMGVPESLNLIYFIIPSLIVSILSNWLIFRNNYKQLGV